MQGVLQMIILRCKFVSNAAIASEYSLPNLHQMRANTPHTSSEGRTRYGAKTPSDDYGPNTPLGWRVWGVGLFGGALQCRTWNRRFGFWQLMQENDLGFPKMDF